MSDQLDDEDDDWCEHCGSTECKGECLDVPVNERPGERLERIAKEDQDRLHQATQELFMQKLFPPEGPNIERKLEDFERQLERRAKVEVVRRPDGTTYRRRV